MGTELDLLEFGSRVCICLDAENNAWGAADMLWWYFQDLDARNE